MYAVPEAVGDGICRAHVLVCNLFDAIVCMLLPLGDRGRWLQRHDPLVASRRN